MLGILYRKTSSYGFSLIYKEMMDRIGIKCHFVEGNHNSIHSNNQDLDLTAGWTKEGNVYYSSNADVLDGFRLFTAPLWIGTTEQNQHYIKFELATVKVNEDNELVMTLYVGLTNSGKLVDQTPVTINGKEYYVFSQATITKN